MGKPVAVTQAFSAAGTGCHILLFSVPGVNSTVEMPLFDIYKKELCITGSIINPDTHQRAVNLPEQRKDDDQRADYSFL